MESGSDPSYDTIIRSIKMMFKNSDPTEKNIASWVNAFISALQHPELIDKERLITELRMELYLCAHYESPDIFDGIDTGHEIWLNEDIKKSVKWLYWDRYVHYLEESGFKPSAVNDIDRVTEDILSRLENPVRKGRWDARGMVVGYIQSGKTANYTGLICKAADAGYKLIIILSGTHKDLRYQTQKRLDYGFIGNEKNFDRKKTVGVGELSLKDKKLGRPTPPEVNCLTDSTKDGDFKKPNSQGRLTVTSPFCLVVKKNTYVLKNISDWVSDSAAGSLTPDLVTDIPLLLIDDEADNSSLNTKKYNDATSQAENDITSINRHIRDILHKFQKSAYIGYTATPYANVFIDPDAKSDTYGSDIFPRNFIISMKRPPGYFGSDSVFGTYRDIWKTQEFFPGIIIVDDEDLEILIPKDRSTDSTYVPKHMPPSLHEAILSFILSCAVRDVRNKGVMRKFHNSMLIHVSRYISVQGSNPDDEELRSGISKLVHSELDEICNRLVVSDPELINEFQELWATSFVPASMRIRDIINDALCTNVTWDQAKNMLGVVVRKITIRVLNGANKENTLDYSKHPDGLTVIAIGGDKLSRGLTLEGLTTSYFLGPARTYDTLLQMGRWFGFRTGYVDVCRIYTTADIIYKFQQINEADDHLRDQLRAMDDKNRTPENYGLKIIQNDSRFRITQQNKMRTGEKQIGNPFSGSLKQTYKFQTTPDIIKDNFRVVEHLIRELNRIRDPEKNRSENYVWKDVPVSVLLKHIPGFKHHPGQAEMGAALFQYITERVGVREKELSKWTVVLINNTNRDAVKGEISGLNIGYSIRNPADGVNPEESGEYCYSKNQIVNDACEEASDLTPDQLREVYNFMMADYSSGKRATDGKKIRGNAKKPVYGEPSGYYVRLVRPVTNGLLLIYPITWVKRVPRDGIPLIGLAYSFPVSITALSQEYMANKPYQEEWMDDDYA